MGNWLWERGFMARDGGGGGGVWLCLPKRAPGPPARFCCDACVLSLAWPESLHLMVYSYSAVQDAVPWGSSRTQYVCKEVTGGRSISQFCCMGVWNVLLFSWDWNDHFQSEPIPQIFYFYFSPKMQMFYSCQTRIFSIILLCVTLHLVV